MNLIEKAAHMHLFLLSTLSKGGVFMLSPSDLCCRDWSFTLTTLRAVHLMIITTAMMAQRTKPPRDK